MKPNATTVLEIILGSLIARWIYEEYFDTKYRENIVVEESPSFTRGGRRIDPVINVKDPYKAKG